MREILQSLNVYGRTLSGYLIPQSHQTPPILTVIQTAKISCKTKDGSSICSNFEISSVEYFFFFFSKPKKSV